MNSIMPCYQCLIVLMVFSACMVLSTVHSHPQCLDAYPPYNTELSYCSYYSGFGCCTAEKDSSLETIATNISVYLTAADRDECGGFLKDILCQECSPYAAHLFNAEGKPTDEWAHFPGLCQDYCQQFHQKCSHILPYITSNENLLSASRSSTAEFCEAIRLDDEDYCHPNVLEEENLNSAVQQGKEGGGDGCLCLEEFANNLRNPLLLVHANDSTHRMYVAEQVGIVYVYFPNGTHLDIPFLDISELVFVTSRRGDERGLLGLAFHPNYAENRKLYVYYTSNLNRTLYIKVSELLRDSNDPNLADPTTERQLLQAETPAANHNGGQIHFGYDGYLYVSIGDGGKAGDPFGEYGNGLNKTTLLGKILRINVDRQDDGLQYAIPETNPFVHGNPTVALHEIYAYGVRNMWRCSVDRGEVNTGYGRGRLFCGDVGQNKYEEIDIIENGGNYGWRAKEGNSCYDHDLCNDEYLENEVSPIHVYSHSVGKSVTGGYMYRGCENPNLRGLYIYGDYWNGRLFKLEENRATGVWGNHEICMGTSSICTGHLYNSFPKNILSFGESEAGELYMLVTDSAVTTNAKGQIFKFVDPSRRGNPEECDVDMTAVDVFGPVSSFKPSNKAQVNCQRICPKKNALTKKKYCQAGYAITAIVLRSTLYNRQVRLQITNITVHRKKGYARYFDSTDELIVTKSLAICDCHKMRIGGRYLFVGDYTIIDGGEYHIKKTSIVRRHHWFQDETIKKWNDLKKCEKKTKQDLQEEE